MTSFIALISAVALLPPPAHATLVQRARFLMGTLAIAWVDGPDSTAAAHGAAAALDEVARLENVMSSWRPTSELARMNAAAGAPFVCSADLFAVVDSSLRFARATGGAFDPTVDPLMIAWDLRGRGRVPSDAELVIARMLVGWERVRLDPERRTALLERSGMGLDLGGIGKGFALDRAADHLGQAGAGRALLNLGGEVLARSSAQPWEVTIAHPVQRLRPVLRIMLANGAVSTSGQAERGFRLHGHRYGHILDPRRGVPVDSRASVTVVAGSATQADALSTALFVMGRKAAAALARGHPELGIVWLEPSGSEVSAWTWNLSSRVPEPGARVRWMN